MKITKDLIYISLIAIIVLVFLFTKKKSDKPSLSTTEKHQIDSLKAEIAQRTDTINMLQLQDNFLRDSIFVLKQAVGNNDVKIKKVYEAYEVKSRIIDSANVTELKQFFSERYH